MRYVALGDSYTIGTSVRAEESWPSQLVARLAPAIELVANPAVNGFTTRDVLRAELPGLPAWRPEIASILIGTNDVIQGIGDPEYRANLIAILDAIEAHTGPGRVFGVTSPDYTVTPAGADYGDPRTRARELRARNDAFTEVLQARGVPVVDILDLSLGAATDRSLVAGDGLHPSGAQYARWVDRIAPVVLDLIG